MAGAEAADAGGRHDRGLVELMTVKELIMLLREFPADAEVRRSDNEDDWSVIDTVALDEDDDHTPFVRVN